MGFTVDVGLSRLSGFVGLLELARVQGLGFKAELISNVKDARFAPLRQNRPSSMSQFKLHMLDEAPHRATLTKVNPESLNPQP